MMNQSLMCPRTRKKVAQLTGDGKNKTIAIVNEASGQTSEIKLAG